MQKEILSSQLHNVVLKLPGTTTTKKLPGATKFLRGSPRDSNRSLQAPSASLPKSGESAVLGLFLFTYLLAGGGFFLSKSSDFVMVKNDLR